MALGERTEEEKMKAADFTNRVTRTNPHREKTQTWRAGQIVTGMEGCSIQNIIKALTAFEEETRDVGIADPARWLTHFAGLESAESGKKMEPWIEIIHQNQAVQSVASFRELLKTHQ
jgi:hypothetical protein